MYLGSLQFKNWCIEIVWLWCINYSNIGKFMEYRISKYSFLKKRMASKRKNCAGFVYTIEQSKNSGLNIQWVKIKVKWSLLFFIYFRCFIQTGIVTWKTYLLELTQLRFAFGTHPNQLFMHLPRANTEAWICLFNWQ